MAAPNQPSQQAPEFPYWPFNCLSLYTHMARDFSRYAQAMTKSTDAMEAAHAEGDFGVRLFKDLMQGYYDLALAPWTAMASVMAERAEDDRNAAEAAAAPQPVKSRRQGN